MSAYTAPLASALARFCRKSVRVKKLSSMPGNARIISPLLEPQVRAAHRVVGPQLLRAAAQDDVPGLQDIGPVGDAECDVGVLLDDEHRDPLGVVELAE